LKRGFADRAVAGNGGFTGGAGGRGEGTGGGEVDGGTVGGGADDGASDSSRLIGIEVVGGEVGELTGETA